MLRLEVEFLSGVCYSASERAASAPEYPPQADRIYSALVAAWAARGEDERERAALEWLERQDPPKIIASRFHARSSVDVFVPPNGAQTGRTGNIHLLPARRRRQPRRFPAAVPVDPTMRLEWEAEPDAGTLEQLCALGADVVYVGHSASFVRARFCRSSDTSIDGLLTRRSPYAGRLAELERAFHLGERPGRGQVVLPDVIIDGAPVAESTFATNWIVLPGNTAEGFVPDTRATAIVTKRMRDALMSSFGSAGEAVPAWISGHEVDGRPARVAHLAIVPMLDVGHSYAGGALLGVALVPPTVVPNAEEVLIEALLRLQLADADVPQMRLQFQAFGKPAEWRLNLTDDDARSSLSPDLYLPKRGARRWASVTPIVVDLHPHAKGAAEAQTEIESLVATSVQRIGLPAPSLIFASKHPAHEGAISAYPSGNAPAWTRWSVPASIATRPLTHAVIEFSSPVHGPLIIGAGRFMGLGLFLPMEESGRDADA